MSSWLRLPCDNSLRSILRIFLPPLDFSHTLALRSIIQIFLPPTRLFESSTLAQLFKYAIRYSIIPIFLPPLQLFKYFLLRSTGLGEAFWEADRPGSERRFGRPLRGISGGRSTWLRATFRAAIERHFWRLLWWGESEQANHE